MKKMDMTFIISGSGIVQVLRPFRQRAVLRHGECLCIFFVNANIKFTEWFHVLYLLFFEFKIYSLQSQVLIKIDLPILHSKTTDLTNKIIQRSLLQISMHCNYCEGLNLGQSRHYNIENVRERFNPTYTHTQIFGTTQPLPSKVRCTPTFHSQAFRVDGYGHNCKGKCNKKPEVVNKTTNVRVDVNKTTKNGDFANYRGKSCYNGRVQWYDQEKNEKFNHIQSTYDYSRQRKYADLASSSVFDGYVYQTRCKQNELCNYVNCQCANCQCGKTKNVGYQQAKIQNRKRTAECQCQICTCVNCQCGKVKEVQCACGQPQRKPVEEVPKQSCSCVDCKCLNCQCGKPIEVQTCKCVNCQCVNCKCENGCSQNTLLPSNNQVVEVEKPALPIDKAVNQQVTFGKKGVSKVQKGLSQPRKVVKEKPTFTVIRQKK